MLSTFRSTASRTLLARGFATTRPTADVSKLTLVGTLVREAETRKTRNDKEYCVYVLATRNKSLPPNADGERPPPSSTFHRIFSFNETSNKYLQALKKGSKVYVEANYELREPEIGSDPSTPLGQRQIFLRHETFRMIYQKPDAVESSPETETESESGSNNYTTGY